MKLKSSGSCCNQHAGGFKLAKIARLLACSQASQSFNIGIQATHMHTLQPQPQPQHQQQQQRSVYCF